MGTSWSVKLAVVDLDAAERAEIKRAIESELRAVDEAMSTWQPESELSRFNAHGSTEPFPASTEILAVFRIASEVSELSGGAFDVTVGPVVTAWGFGASDRIPAPPPPEDEPVEVVDQYDYSTQLHALAKRPEEQRAVCVCVCV